jgi:DNA-binding XRE family transcriptional regulator
MSGIESDNNPVASIRVSFGWTTKELSENAGVVLQTVYDVEKGVLANVPEKISQAFRVRHQTLNMEFQQWKTRQRKSLVFLPPDSPRVIRAIEKCREVDQHPFTAWHLANGYNLTTLCEVLKVQRKAVINYVNFGQKSMPESLKEALREIQYTDAETLMNMTPSAALDELIRLGDDFFEMKSRERLEQSRVTRELYKRDDGDGRVGSV